MKTIILSVLTLGLSSNLFAKEVFICDLFLNDNIIKTQGVDYTPGKTIQIDLGLQSGYRFGGGVKGDYKYAWYWFDQVGTMTAQGGEVTGNPVTASTLSEFGEKLEVSCDLHDI
jgi:hypothetical protein